MVKQHSYFADGILSNERVVEDDEYMDVIWFRLARDE